MRRCYRLKWFPVLFHVPNFLCHRLTPELVLTADGSVFSSPNLRRCINLSEFVLDSLGYIAEIPATVLKTLLEADSPNLSRVIA